MEGNRSPSWAAAGARDGRAKLLYSARVGRVTFGRALTVGLLVTLVASACYVASWEVFYDQFAPDFGAKYAAYAVEQARKAGATDAQIAVQIQQAADFQAMYKKPLVNIAFTLLESLPVGLLFTVVTAGVLRRKGRVEGTVAA